MGGLYLGGELVTPVIEKKVEVAKTKFGASIDSFLGEVVDGKYMHPESDEVITFSGLTSVANYGFSYSFTGHKGKFCFPDLIEVGNNAFYNAWEASIGYLSVSFDKLEEINSNQCFEDAFKDLDTGHNEGAYDITFPSLKKVNANRAFYYAFPVGGFVFFDKMFPVIEYVAGNRTFGYLITGAVTCDSASNLNTIVGATTQSDATFLTGYQSSNAGLFLPRATNVSGYIAKPYSSSRALNLHFAIANQAAIEACDGYDYKFGATEIYFDLVLEITVNGTVYSRKLCCADRHPSNFKYDKFYTSWQDASGNTVYTYARTYYYANGYEEPAVGTVVYSDLGTTQVGTVEGVA